MELRVSYEPYTVRLRYDQAAEIEETRHLRNDAIILRTRVSLGSYNDEDHLIFSDLVARAGMALRASNPQLGNRVGLGGGFFSSVTRDGRRPKLTNFLKALTAIIEVADERLFDVDSKPTSIERQHIVNISDPSVAVLAKYLGEMARTEIQNLDSQRPNDISSIAMLNKQRELLVVFAEGFEKIASALFQLHGNTKETLLLRRASDAVTRLGNHVDKWLSGNSEEAVDWFIRIPVFAAGVALLSVSGASMVSATPAVAALVGGKKVFAAINKVRTKAAKRDRLSP